ncbi:B12-binding domain-containing radical SAM protein [Candidatus Bipolaricaulota bacterium]
MNVLLIYPRFSDTFWSFKYALRFIRKRAFSPPLGLLTVAAMLPREWGKRLVDVNVAMLTDKDLEWADYAFISGMTIQQDSAQEIIARCKKAGLTVVAGGPMFTTEQDAFGEVDHLVLNEAELTLPLFLADLAAGRAQRVYSTTGFADIHQSPMPLWELVDMRHYASMIIQFSRGCPFNCEFCSVTELFGHQTRLKAADQVIAELDGLYELGWHGPIFSGDDNLIGSKRYLKDKLLPALIEWRKDKEGVQFATEVSINLADDAELMQMMVDAGFTTVFIGIETPDEDSLTECGKNLNTNRDMIDDVKRIQHAGLQVQGGFIVGFDSDTPAIFQRQIDFIQESGIVTAMVGLLQAIPGTRLFERLRAEGRLRDQVSGNNADGTTNFVPAMDFDTLQAGYRRIMRTIYSPRLHYRRIKVFLREYTLPRNRTHLDLQHILAFLRSIYHLGIKSRGRFHYWKLLVWAAVRRPKAFPLAVTLAIYGYHFRRSFG